MNQVSPTGLAKSGMWNGTRLEGQIWTEQQKAQMLRLRGTTEAWDVRTITLKQPREPNEADRLACRPREQCFDTVRVSCPIIQRGMDTDTIITPGGDHYRAHRQGFKA